MSGNSRSAPSTIWASLAMPNPPIGSIPFVDTDGASITTDILHYFYTALGAATAELFAYQQTVWGGIRVGYTDASLVVGAPTKNKPSGTIKIASGTSSLQVISSYMLASSLVFFSFESADATLTRVTVATADGQFVVTGNAAATADVYLSFFIVNTCATGP